MDVLYQTLYHVSRAFNRQAPSYIIAYRLPCAAVSGARRERWRSFLSALTEMALDAVAACEGRAQAVGLLVHAVTAGSRPSRPRAAPTPSCG